MKDATHEAAERMRIKAVNFLANVVGDPDKADEFDEMSTEEYAEHKGLRLINPDNRRTTVALTKTQLEQRLREAQEYAEELEERLDAVAGIAMGDDEDDEDEDGDDQDADDEDGDEEGEDDEDDSGN